MADINQFGSARPQTVPDAKVCAQCESLLADAVDGVLSPADQVFFDQHVGSCAACGTTLAEAMRGAAWMGMLKANPPEPSAALMDRILAETSARTAEEQETLRAVRRADVERASLLGAPLPLPTPAALGPEPAGASVLPFRSRADLRPRLRALTHAVLQPRFMMTAAMAFFSIALTLNVSGVHLDQIHASDLRPSSLRRDFYQANAHVVRYYDNLRVVYELESRVHDLQRTSDENSAAPAYPADEKAPKPKDGAPDPKQGPQSKPNSGRGAAGTHVDPKSDDSRHDPSTAPEILMASGERAGDLLNDPAAAELRDVTEIDSRTQLGRAL